MIKKKPTPAAAVEVPEATWAPEIDGSVTVHPGTAEETTGRIVEDFGEFDAYAVDANDVRIAEPARRWAVLTTDGHLLFVDTHHLAAPPGHTDTTTAD